MSLDEKRHHMVEYDILNVVSFPGSLGLLIKVGKFGSNSPYDQSFVINKEMMNGLLDSKTYDIFSKLDVYTVDILEQNPPMNRSVNPLF